MIKREKLYIALLWPARMWQDLITALVFPMPKKPSWPRVRHDKV